MQSLIENKNYLIVHLNGKAKFHIENIMSKILDKTWDKYPDLSDGRMTMMCKNRKPFRKWEIGKGYVVVEGRFVNDYYQSFLESCLENIIDHSKPDSEGWYSNTWSYESHGETRDCIIDSIFYDEFLFLTLEGLMEVEDFEFLTDEDIWINFIVSDEIRKNPEFTRMYECTSIEELKKEYRKLIKNYHPDIAGSDHSMAAKLIHLYSVLIKKFK